MSAGRPTLPFAKRNIQRDIESLGRLRTALVFAKGDAAKKAVLLVDALVATLAKVTNETKTDAA